MMNDFDESFAGDFLSKSEKRKNHFNSCCIFSTSLKFSKSIKYSNEIEVHADK
jgi:hypothetical protein